MSERTSRIDLTSDRQRPEAAVTVTVERPRAPYAVLQIRLVRLSCDLLVAQLRAAEARVQVGMLRRELMRAAEQITRVEEENRALKAQNTALLKGLHRECAG